ncbi:MAG: ABC transporter six-transmembrane domain-containing protein [Planctomycetes bacterium]|nr:ABC transporter six-transmembrane domain-containing protein [Planctomycetota bacterium]
MTIATSIADRAIPAPSENAAVAGGEAVVRRGPTLRSLFSTYRWRLLATYLLFNLENVLRLLQPLVLGLAIDGLLRQSYTGLAWFVAQHLAHLLISSFRQMYDTRAFAAIYSDLATELVVRQRRDAVDLSRVTARSALSRGFVEFFERHVPLVIRSAYSIGGALLLLAWYDWVLVAYCLVLLVPAMLLNAAYSRKTLALSRCLHDRYEGEVDVIGQGDPSQVRAHYDEVGRWRVRLSDAEAVNFSLMELFVLAALAGSLVHFCTTANPAAGEIFAVFRYVLMFIMGLDAVPKLVAQLSSLRDVGFRLAGPKAA